LFSGFPIAHWFGAEKPATANEQNQANEPFRKWLLSSVRPHPDGIPQLTISQDSVEHLGCQRPEQEPADGERIADALTRLRLGAKDPDHLLKIVQDLDQVLKHEEQVPTILGEP
jgi:hypothetical protein